jgi:hypothetical protein
MLHGGANGSRDGKRSTNKVVNKLEAKGNWNIVKGKH